MNLDLTNKSLEVKLAANVAANQLTWVAHYVDIYQPTVSVTAIAEADGVTNNTSNVAMVSAPAANTTRRIQEFTVENTDTATATVTIQYNDNGTRQTIVVVQLLANSTLVFANGSFSIIPVPGTSSASTSTTTSTGTQANFATGLIFVIGQVSTLRCNNATLLTLSGISGGVDGALLEIISVGTGQVDLSPQDSGSSAANRLINNVSSIKTSLAAGFGTCMYEYDGTTQRWRLVQHVQGGTIAYTPVWTGSISNPAIGNGTLTGNYLLRGTELVTLIQMTAGSTTTFGSGFWQFSLIGGLTPSGVSLGVALSIDIGGGVNYPGVSSYSGFGSGGLLAINTAANANVDSTHPFAWANTDIFRIEIESTIT